MIYVISKSTFGNYDVRDIQCNANWDCCPYSDYALIPDNLVEGVLATQGYCDITLNADGTEVTGFTARSIPSVPEECCSTNTVLSVNGVKADTNGAVSLTPDNVGAAPAGYGLGANLVGETGYKQVNHAEADSLNKTGIYWFVDYANSFYPDGWNSGTSGLLIHFQHNTYNTGSAKQIFIPYYKCGVSDSSGSDDYVVVERTRRNDDGTWTPIEWRNPPMSVDVEYRTTERWYGRPVFTQLVDCGFGPNRGITETQIKVPEGTYFERGIFCSVHGANSSIVLPIMGNDVTLDFGCAGVISDRVRISTNVDGSGVHYYATVKYLKQGV